MMMLTAPIKTLVRQIHPTRNFAVLLKTCESAPINILLTAKESLLKRVIVPLVIFAQDLCVRTVCVSAAAVI